ncbi:hypothetical protein NPIL_570241 [Nephila pilipes]|uniref:Uncharacterized protein n=1 Tax=Nephila pilipes TaxID=299642 RepID=A0A8X6T673_NEPPI|nr:hypothetical protein NPIL_570241 [Nephila pilipes]
MTSDSPAPKGFFDGDVFSQILNNEDLEDCEKYNRVLEAYVSWCTNTTPRPRKKDIREACKTITSFFCNLLYPESDSARQLAACERQCYNVGRDIDALNEVIAEANVQLEEATKYPTKEMQCAAMLAVYSQLPAREETMNRIEEMRIVLENLKSKTEILCNKLHEEQKHKP